ncbi:MAG TPA: hypothetical protein VF190_15165, partial [Rhodothermales bacterium]
MHRILLAFAAVLCTVQPAFAQADFQLDAYRSFLEVNRDIAYDDLARLHPAGVFEDAIGGQFGSGQYANEIDEYFVLTPYEKELMGRH